MTSSPGTSLDLDNDFLNNQLLTDDQTGSVDIQCSPPPFGAIAQLPDVDELSREEAQSGGGSSVPYAAIAGGVAAAAMALLAGGWYASRRWLR